ncbi:unnamed protein product [Symbiodinium sp. CCMP2592]|nr:unnamed protein product [Symbiodinium sp. CCMP2592]
MNTTSAMGPCPGVITNEIILDPYENVGQYGGAILGAGLPALFFLASWGFNCCRVIEDGSGGCEVADSWPGFCYRILYTGYFALFTVSLLLQVLASLLSFAGENIELLFARVLVAVACGCRLCIGVGVAEGLFPSRLWILAWMSSVGLTVGFVAVILAVSDAFGTEDPGEFVEASAVSVAYLWMILVWTLASRKNPKIRPYLKIKVPASVVLMAAFWVRALFEPSCGPRGHAECYASCGLGAAGVHHILFGALLLIPHLVLQHLQVERDRDLVAMPQCCGPSTRTRP